ncbi:hypothetical protein SAMD00019534_061780 [Acytostelium subglobosum LB1]|uniref:hypothetical protein n=1 Tax=Acytostelium subglobosum LB1 TaxID=1410327 RepID=UPI0006449B89|nr:hypothetical protein SAMD00019534_061780 [Acytostelium subglobosum LB1]GAM23003.1 hypothetical protein SAMD00019534_061780 [Acytostelium subglobosum LB1]|eukprot:XP_012754230.1 hypothetical protein SAMD00019534_061780 [Acytostelium subglobosum LB1]
MAVNTSLKLTFSDNVQTVGASQFQLSSPTSFSIKYPILYKYGKQISTATVSNPSNTSDSNTINLNLECTNVTVLKTERRMNFCYNLLVPPTLSSSVFSTSYYTLTLSMTDSKSCTFNQPIIMNVTSNSLPVITWDVPSAMQPEPNMDQIQFRMRKALTSNAIRAQSHFQGHRVGLYYDMYNPSSLFYTPSNALIFPVSGNKHNATYYQQHQPYYGVDQESVPFILNTYLVTYIEQMFNLSYQQYLVSGSIDGNEVVLKNSSIASGTITCTCLDFMKNKIQIAPKTSNFMIRTDVSFPIGAINGNFQKYTFNLPLRMSDCSNTPMQTELYSYTIIYDDTILSNGALSPYPAVSCTDNVTPSIFKINMIPLTQESFILQITAMDTTSGVYRIYSSNLAMLMNESHLVSGDVNNGVYEMEVAIPYDSLARIDFNIEDRANNNFLVNSYVSLPGGGLSPGMPFQANWCIETITQFYFVKNNQDVTNLDVDNTLFFNSSNANPVLQPVFETYLPNYLNVKRFIGRWNPAMMMYQVDFTLYRNQFEGKVLYNIKGYPSITSSMFEAAMGSNATLTVRCQNADAKPPVITKVVAIPSNKINYQGAGIAMFGWDVTIQDDLNGLASATFKVTSSLDPLPYVINFVPNNTVSGDSKLGTYQIRLPLTPGMVNQSFTFKDAITLVDQVGNTAESLYQSSTTFFDPLEQILYTQQETQLVIDVMTPNPVDTSGPVISNAIVSVSLLDVGSTNRTITVDLDAATVTSGMSTRNPPLIVINSFNFDYISAPMTQTTTMAKGAHYKGSITVPYGYGSAGYPLILSVYGVMSNHKQVSSLPNLATIRRTFSMDIPIIESASSYLRTDTLITLRGHGFGNNSVNVQPRVTVPKTTPETLILTPPIMCSYTVMVVDVKYMNYPYMDIIVNVGQKQSNLLRIYPTDPAPPTTPVPTNPASKCPGNPPCSNHGTCLPSFNCQCDQGWEGPFCDLEYTPVIPTIDPKTPTTNIIDANLSISSFVSIVSLRELDNSDNPVNEYHLSGWTINNRTSTNRTLLDFTCSVSPNRSTLITVTLEYFKTAQNITFAGHDLLMIPGSIKTLYGRFINFGVIDYRVATITNTVLKADANATSVKTSTTSALVGINIPHYTDFVQLDPDFSVLVNQSPGECGKSDTNGLSRPALAGIIVGATLGAVILALVITYVLVKRKVMVVVGKRIRMNKFSSE